MLQKVTGHLSLIMSLTYLRGLELAELTEDDMPKGWGVYLLNCKDLLSATIVIDVN